VREALTLEGPSVIEIPVAEIFPAGGTDAWRCWADTNRARNSSRLPLWGEGAQTSGGGSPCSEVRSGF